MATGRNRPDREDRRQQKLWALQDRDPKCRHCGYDRPNGLEQHHIAGRKHHDDTVIVCRNCHSELSDLQLDHFPYDRSPPQNELATTAFYVLGVCDAHTMDIERLRQLCIRLIELSEQEEK